MDVLQLKSSQNYLLIVPDQTKALNIRKQYTISTEFLLVGLGCLGSNLGCLQASAWRPQH